MRHNLIIGLFVLLLVSLQQIAMANLNCVFCMTELPKDGHSSQQMHWYKGNTHCHTINTDADATPEEVVSWYRKHGYNFLVITDGNFLTRIDGLNAIFAKQDQFLVIQGEEILDQFVDKSLDVVAIDIDQTIVPLHGKSVNETIKNNVLAVRQTGGIPQVCHPNYTHSLVVSDLMGLKQVKLLEVYNAHPVVNSIGAGGLIPVEKLWDQALTAGQLFYAVAADDSHRYTGEFSVKFPNPGRGWIMVRAPELTIASLRESLEKGDFYASTGVTLSEYLVTETGISVKISPENGMRYTTSFIGEGGKVLATCFELASEYKFTGQEKYVRVRILDSKGTFAWSQPVFIEGAIHNQSR